MTTYRPEMPLIIQSDRTILLEVQNPHFEQARNGLATFCELLKSPEYMHTYRITPLSLWNAAASGMTAEMMLDILREFSKFEVPVNIQKEIEDYVSRYGLLRLEKRGNDLVLVSDDPMLLKEIGSYKSLKPYLPDPVEDGFIVPLFARGLIKQELIKLGFPVKDLAGYTEGEHLSISLSPALSTGKPFDLRDYQQDAVDAFYADGSVYGGSGVLVLPCGAGKTVIGIGVMSQVQSATLILTTNTTSVRQWISEVLEKTTLTPDMIGEYTGSHKEVQPVTVATYQILTHRRSVDDEFTHMGLFNEKDWGLIIYDEVHLLPAPVFRMTADIQAKRRLGLTATLVREDGREEDVFTLVGPKKFDVPWKDLESRGWIADAQCTEIRVSMDFTHRESYAIAEGKQKFRIAAENPKKLEVVQQLLLKHENDQTLIIGQYIDQLIEIAEATGAPLITGKTPQDEREKLYSQFKKGEIKTLIVSKVANFAIDLPDASVAIQVSGTFGSRQEEAQRLGRILRPKSGENTAYFYSIVSRDTKDQEFALKRQLFLVEQGYKYTILDM